MGKARVLIVEDEEDLREILVISLETAGFEVFSASGGNQAKSFLSQQKDIDVVVSDIRMPNGGGVDLLQAIRKADPHLPVTVIMTGYSDIPEGELMKAGAFRVLSKPFNSKEFILTVEEAAANCLQVSAGS